jgi:hypothetical protein
MSTVDEKRDQPGADESSCPRDEDLHHFALSVVISAPHDGMS